MKAKLVLSLIFYSTFILAQSKLGSVKWGPLLKNEKSNPQTIKNGFDGNSIYFSSDVGNENYFKSVDNSLNTTKICEFTKKDAVSGEKYDFQSNQYFAHKLYFFKSTNEKKVRNLYAEEINKQTMTATGKTIKISEMNLEENEVVVTRFAFSSDSNIMVISERVLNRKVMTRQEKSPLKITVLDNNLNKIWEKTLEIPLVFSSYSYEQYFVGNDGAVKICGSVLKGKSVSDFEVSSHIFSISDQGNTVKDKIIELENKSVGDFKIKENEDGKIICVGVYGYGGLNPQWGTFFLILNPVTLQVESSNFKEFEKEKIIKYLSEAEEERSNKKLEKGKFSMIVPYVVRDLLQRPDGGMVLVTEQYGSTFKGYDAAPKEFGQRTLSQRALYEYHYYDIVVSKISPNGVIEWTKRVSKKQDSQDYEENCSYGVAINNDRIILVYNDHRENLSKGEDERWENFNLGKKYGIATVAALDNSGNLTKEMLMDNNETEIVLRPKVCMQIDANKLLLVGDNGTKEQYGILNF